MGFLLRFLSLGLLASWLGDFFSFVYINFGLAKNKIILNKLLNSLGLIDSNSSK